MAPRKTIRIKNNTNDWFDREIAEKIAAREKLFSKFLKSKFVDEILCKELRNTVQALIKDKKRRLLLDKLSEKYSKIKSFGKLQKNGFTRQKGSHNKHIPQYEKRVDIFSQVKHF